MCRYPRGGDTGHGVLIRSVLRRNPLRKNPLRRNPLRKNPLRRNPLGSPCTNRRRAGWALREQIDAERAELSVNKSTPSGLSSP